jgi:hypothetical protein
MACQQLGWTDVPTISLEHLTEAQARALHDRRQPAHRELRMGRAFAC